MPGLRSCRQALPGTPQCFANAAAQRFATRSKDKPEGAPIDLEESCSGCLQQLSGRNCSSATEQKHPRTSRSRKGAVPTWYEVFPRSGISQEGVHGNFRDCESSAVPRLMGFDVVYFRPTYIWALVRKGKIELYTEAAAHSPPAALGNRRFFFLREGGNTTSHSYPLAHSKISSPFARAESQASPSVLDDAFSVFPELTPYVRDTSRMVRQASPTAHTVPENPPRNTGHFSAGFESPQWGATRVGRIKDAVFRFME